MTQAATSHVTQGLDTCTSFLRSGRSMDHCLQALLPDARATDIIVIYLGLNYLLFSSPGRSMAQNLPAAPSPPQ